MANPLPQPSSLEQQTIGAESNSSALAPPPTLEDREYPRINMSVRWIAKITGDSGQNLCLVRNISEGGLMVSVFSDYYISEKVTLELKSGFLIKGEVIWIDHGSIGIQFTQYVNVGNVLHPLPATKEGQKARLPRIDVRGTALLVVDDMTMLCQLVNISLSGARLLLPAPITSDEHVTMVVRGMESHKCEVRWQSGVDVGLAFLNPIPLIEMIDWLNVHMKEQQPAEQKQKRLS